MLTRMLACIPAICLFAALAAADTVIEYTLDGGWTYEQYPGTVSLADNPSGGIIVTIDVPTGIDDGGLVASKHALPGFSLDNDGFVQLEYRSLSSAMTGSPEGLDLCLELEFYDAGEVLYEIGIAMRQNDEGVGFSTWFETDVDGFYDNTPAPAGLPITEGVLGFYSDGSLLLPYFRDAAGSVLYPFAAWDISGITGAHNYGVDNDFEAGTLGGGTVAGSVNLERVVYGPGSPVPGLPVHRFWSERLKHHFYTISETEKNKLIDQHAATWAYEGPAYQAFAAAGEPGTLPVYRFWSDRYSGHFYTINESEKDKLVTTYSHVWTYEGPVFYAYPEGSEPAETSPVYRFWSNPLNGHFYTISEMEKDKLVTQYPDTWAYEGIAWYAYE